MEMHDLIVIENTPALLSANFDELKASLAAELEKYDLVVTAETVADAKKLATELNKTKKVIDDRRKEEVAKASEPIRLFDDNMKELAGMCGTGRQKLLDQITRFEDESRARAADLLGMYLDKLNADLEVQPEFQRATFDDIAKKLTSLTDKGNLAKPAKDELEMRVRNDRALQDRTERRLLELENQSHRAGLAAPLTRDHVVNFLFADEEKYAKEVERMIAVEVERQEQAEIRLRKQIDKEQERASVQTEKPAPAEAEPAKEAPKYASAPPPAGRVPHRVTCTFEVAVKEGTSPGAIQGELRRVLEKAGITTLQTINVERLSVRDAA